MEEDKGRQVPPHRSGGGARVVVGGGIGHSRLALVALLAATAGMEVVGPAFPITRRRGDDGPAWPPTQKPDDRGRRAEKDSAALAKAEAKRQRKAAKRLALMTPNG